MPTLRPKSRFDRANPPPVWDRRIGDAVEEYPYCCWVDSISPDGCLEPPDIAGQGGGRWRRIEQERPDIHVWADSIVQAWGYGQTFRGLRSQETRNRVICAMIVRSRAAHDYLFGLRLESTAYASSAVSTVIGLIGAVLANTNNPVTSAIGAALLAGAALVSAGAAQTISRIQERLAAGEEPTGGDVDECAIAAAVLDASGVVLDAAGAIVQSGDSSTTEAISAGLEAAAALVREGCQVSNPCDVVAALLATGDVVFDAVENEILVNPDADPAVLSTVRSLYEQLGPSLLAVCAATQGGQGGQNTPPEGQNSSTPRPRPRQKPPAGSSSARSLPILAAAVGFLLGGPTGAVAGFVLASFAKES